MSDIFISYAREDRSRASALAAALGAHGWSVWWDREIRTGRRFDDVIDEALTTARSVVVLWSRVSIAKDWVLEEAEDGRDRGILIPVLIEQIKPPRGFRRYQAADLTDWNGKTAGSAFQKLVTDIAATIGPPPGAERGKQSPIRQGKTKPEPGEEKRREAKRESKREANAKERQKRKAEASRSTREDAERESKRKANAKARRRRKLEALRRAREEAERSKRVLREGEARARQAERGPLQAPAMVLIPAGVFQMGESGLAEEPLHEVHISKRFAIGKFTVTFEEYDRFADATGRDLTSDEGWGRGNRPAINMHWEDAGAYCEWLSRELRGRYRLPTEAEWEYAARAGSRTAYWWGATIGHNRANCLDCGSPWDGIQTAPVGSFAANPFGLHDTAGNVWEWVRDCWTAEGSTEDGSAREKSFCIARVVRGGAFYSQGYRVSSASRSYRDFLTLGPPGGELAGQYAAHLEGQPMSPYLKNLHGGGCIGFRLAQDIE